MKCVVLGLGLLAMTTAEAQGITPGKSFGHAAAGPSRTSLDRQKWGEFTFDKAALRAEFDGQRLWVGSDFGGVYYWDANTGQSRNFTRVGDGLLDNGVLDLALEGSDVWVGHWSGVSHFDGEAWETFDSSNSPINSGIAIEVDAQGIKWVGTWDQGLFRFDGTTWTQYSTANSGLSDNLVTSIETNAQGELWIGAWGNGVDHFDGQNWTNFTPGNSGLLSVFAWVRATHPTDDRVWFYCHDDDFDPDVGIVQYDGSTWQALLPPGGGGNQSFAGPQAAQGIHSEYIHSVIVDSSDAIWFQGSQGFSRLVGADWTFFGGVSSGFDFNLPRGSAMSVSSAGELWAATGQGIARFDGNDFEPHATSGLWDMDVADVVVDPSGATWMATRFGLHRYQRGNWARFTAANSPLQSDICNALAVTPSGGVLVGTTQGAARFENGQWTIYTTANSGLHSDKVFALAASSSGALWFGSDIYGGGVSRFEDGVWTVFTTQNSPLASNSVGRIVQDPASDAVWFASSLGADRYLAGTWTHESIGQAGGDTLRDIAFAPNGDVWFARWQGASRLSLGVVTDFTPSDGLAENNSNAIVVDDLGRVWLGHHEEGLSRFDGQTWQTLDVADGLTSNRVLALDVGPDGAVWFGTSVNAGVFDRRGL